MELHLIRHTPVELKNNICYGRIDVPLSNSFVSDCEIIKKKLSKNYDIVFISPSKRCVELAKKLGYKTFITDEKLLELNFGDWEGKEWDKINQKQLNKWMKKFVNVAPPNGESFIDMFNRIQTFIENLRVEKYNKVLIITHSGVIRCFLAKILGFPLENSFKLPIGFNEHYVIKLSSDSTFDFIQKFK